MTAAATMTREDAATFLKGHGTQVKRLWRMGKVALAIEERRLMADQGVQRIHGGPFSKDEYIASVLNLRGYTTERLNQATHISAHMDAVWPDCPWCAGGAS